MTNIKSLLEGCKNRGISVAAIEEGFEELRKEFRKIYSKADEAKVRIRGILKDTE